MTTHIIAMGHGGFSLDPDDPILDRYILEQTKKARPKVCFLPQAGSESVEYLIKFYRSFAALGAEPSDLSLFRLPTADLADFLLKKDVLYVGGGNTKSMLALWRAWELDVILRQAWEAGVVLAGLSAGAICWFESGVTDSVPGALTALPCLGFLPGSCCPHYDMEPYRRPSYHRLVREGQLGPGYALDDGAAIHFVEGEAHAVLSSRPDATAYQVVREDGAVHETALESISLFN